MIQYVKGEMIVNWDIFIERNYYRESLWKKSKDDLFSDVIIITI
jgi:hypothetical protein